MSQIFGLTKSVLLSTLTDWQCVCRVSGRGLLSHPWLPYYFKWRSWGVEPGIFCVPSICFNTEPRLFADGRVPSAQFNTGLWIGVVKIVSFTLLHLNIFFFLGGRKGQICFISLTVKKKKAKEHTIFSGIRKGQEVSTDCGGLWVWASLLQNVVLVYWRGNCLLGVGVWIFLLIFPYLTYCSSFGEEGVHTEELDSELGKSSISHFCCVTWSAPL